MYKLEEKPKTPDELDAVKQELKADKWLRREACGDSQLMKLLVEREVASLYVTAVPSSERNDSVEMQHYLHLSSDVVDYKQRNNLPNPPPLSPEDD